MNLPCLMEMGDINPAIENLLLLQAKYARQDGVSRAQRDVAYNAVAAEIERYILARLKSLDDATKALRTLQGYNESIRDLKINFRPDDHLAIIKLGLNGWPSSPSAAGEREDSK